MLLPQIRCLITLRIEISIISIDSNITDNIIRKVINVSYIYLLCICFCETEVCPLLLVVLSEEFLEFRIFRLDSNHFPTWSFYKPCSKEIRHNILVPIPMQCYKNTSRSDTGVILILALIITVKTLSREFR